MSKRIDIQDDTELEQTGSQNIQDDTELKQTDSQNGSEESEQNGCRSDNGPSDALPSEDLALKLAAAEEQAREHYDRLLRVSADFDNYKKRTAREMQDIVKYANEKIVKELLTLVDNLERAIESASQQCAQDDPLVRGVELTLNETRKMLERYHVVPIQALGQPFNPSFHQAMMQEEVADQPSNTVVKELQKGYTMHERLLRPALVSVSKSGEPKNEA